MWWVSMMWDTFLTSFSFGFIKTIDFTLAQKAPIIFGWSLLSLCQFNCAFLFKVESLCTHRQFFKTEVWWQSQSLSVYTFYSNPAKRSPHITFDALGMTTWLHDCADCPNCSMYWIFLKHIYVWHHSQGLYQHYYTSALFLDWNEFIAFFLGY